MTWTLAGQLGYLLLTVPMTLWVAATLSRHARNVLCETLENEDLAAPVARLSAVGFLLVSIGTVLVTLPAGSTVPDAAAFLRVLGSKVGVAALLTATVYLGVLWILHVSRPRPRVVVPPAAPWGWAPTYPHPAHVAPAYRTPPAFPPPPATVAPSPASGALR